MFSVFMVYVVTYIENFLVTSFCFSFSELSLLGLIVDLLNKPLCFSAAMTLLVG